MDIKAIMSQVIKRNPGEVEFHQAVQEVFEKLVPFIGVNPRYEKAKILERLIEPERVLMFRVPWFDDKGEMQINRGYRVQYSSTLGPYKGGLRFTPTLTLGTVKFLAFEQIFKNALTTLPMGGAKGGADFDPKGRSENEVMRFCQSFMTELYKYIGQEIDVPAGDMGVGGREIGYMFGQYKRMTNNFSGVLTGKSIGSGGSLMRPEATGYGLAYFGREILAGVGDSYKDKKICVSGSGNVALYAVEKLTALGAVVLTVSDSKGTLYFPEGIKGEELKSLMAFKFESRGSLKEFEGSKVARYLMGKKPWGVDHYNIAAPCATQNEILLEDAQEMVKKGCRWVFEGANMPTDLEATKYLVDKGITFAPGKAANAGGVSVSGLEISQNAQHLSWSAEEVDRKLQAIMANIYSTCAQYGKEGDQINFIKGANIGGFVRVAEAMLAQGLV